MKIPSLLDNDQYKFSMQCAVNNFFPRTPVEYRFINRRKEGKITQAFVDKLKAGIDEYRSQTFSDRQIDKISCSLPGASFAAILRYANFLKGLNLNKSNVEIKCVDNELELIIKGFWNETILFEVPFMAMISELYFEEIDKNWEFNKEAYKLNLDKKYETLSKAGCLFSDFGTRRRRNFMVQDCVVEHLAGRSNFLGTSNVELASTYGITPLGTMAHEWFMGISAINQFDKTPIESLTHANFNALSAWSDMYHKSNMSLIALSDTYTTNDFFKWFKNDLMLQYNGVRHDSGDPIEFANRVVAHYKENNIDPMLANKIVVFSDGLNPEEATRIKAHTDSIGINAKFGIGTNLTNDFGESKALNMVIKLWSCNETPVVKLSDNPGKASGDPAAVAIAKGIFCPEEKA